MDRRQAIAASLSFLAAPLVAAAQGRGGAEAEFPNRPVSLVCYSAAGGPVDLLARLLADGLKATYPKPVLVENRTGAAGVAASLHVKSQPPDGHTLLYGAMTTAIFAPQIRPQLPYDTRTDLTPIAQTAGYVLLLVAAPEVPFRTAPEMVAYAKANPGKLNYGTNGFGAWTHIAMELFMDRTGINLVHVPYTGNAPVLQVVLAGDIQLGLVDINLARQHVADGKLRVVGQLGAERAPQFPETPTLGETVRELATDFWLGIFGPPGMAPELVRKLNRDVNAFMETPAMKQRAAEAFMRIETATPEAFAARVKRDWEFWGGVIRAKNLIMK